MTGYAEVIPIKSTASLLPVCRSLVRSHYRCALMNKFLGSQHNPWAECLALDLILSDNQPGGVDAPEN